MLAVVDEVLFQRLDQRVATWLLNHASIGDPIKVTHQEIAADLGSSREVISRILEDFQQAGLVEMERGAITLIDKTGLESRRVM